MRLTSRWGVLLAAVTLVVLALATAGCGSSDSTTEESVAPSSAGTAAATWTEADLAAIEADPALMALLPEAIKSAGEIKAAADIPYPPWEYFDPPTSKDPAGFDYDISQAIGKKIGITVPFVQTPFDSIILSIKGGKNDMILSAMYDNAERQAEGISFVDYAYDGSAILVKKGNPEGITNLDSLSGKTVAAMTGGTQEMLLRSLNKELKAAGKPEVTVLAPQGQPPCLLAVSGGRAAAYLTDNSVAAFAAQTTNDGNTFEVIRDPAAPQGYEPQIMGIGMAAENTGLIQAVQQALQALIDEGTYQRIVDKYGLLPVESAEVNMGGADATQ